MKISHRLTAMSALSAAALCLVAGMSWYAITSIQSDLEGLTQRAGPLQTKTFELQERTERLMGGLLRLSLVRSTDDAARTVAGADADLQAIDKLRGEIRQLDPKAAPEGIDFKAARGEIATVVDKRLADESAYQKESAAAAASLARAEQAVAVTRKAAQQIGVEAAQAADRAQDAARRLSATIRGALAAQARLKEFQLVIGEADMVSNRFRLTPTLSVAMADGDHRRAMAALRRSLAVETGCAVAILALVAWLGTLEPTGG